MLSTSPPKLGGSCVRTVLDAIDVDPLFLVSESAALEFMEEFGIIPSPNNDIWKKFELLPTPPRSPDRSEKTCCDDIFEDSVVVDDVEALRDITFEHDNLIEDLLREDFDFPSGDEMFDSTWCPEVSDLSSRNELLHDCMWSGKCSEDCKQQAARERLQVQELRLTPSPVEAPTTPTPEAASTSLSSPVVLPDVMATTVLDEEEVVETQCVDPSSVLAYTPLSDHCYYQAGDASTNPSPPTPKQVPVQVLIRSRGVWKREYVVSDTPSESDDDDDDEEEDEEIDVVTVAGERQQQQHYAQPRTIRTPLRGSRPRAPSPSPRMTSSGRVINPTTKRENVQPTVRRKRMVTVGSKRRRARHVVVPPPKKARRVEVVPETPRPRLVPIGMSSRSSSDSEDFERRREHNSMERKRRDDLRSAFQQLRAIVPELQENSKAPKVAILSQAAAHARQLTAQHGQIERTLRHELQRQRMLQKRLAEVKRQLRVRS
ncbi:transcriptional regulator Myc-A-like [Ornithodoros turicata]